MIGTEQKTKWGTNWQIAGGHLDVDALDFGPGQSLQALLIKLEGRSGRQIFRRHLSSNYFTLEGRDKDSTLFYVEVREQAGQVRGISIAYSAFNEATMRQIASGFEAFPTSHPVDVPPPPPPQAELSVKPSPAPTPAAVPAEPDKSEALKQELAAAKAQLEAIALERKLREQTEAIRNEERKKLELEFALKEEERKARDQVEARRIEEERRKLDEEKRKQTEQLAKIEKQLLNLSLSGGSKPETIGNDLSRFKKRVALVVGNNQYPQFSASEQLKTAINDARQVKSALEQIGFEVIQIGENLTRREFFQAWQKFVNRIDNTSAVAFFYAGHGIQIASQNYLLPSDSPPAEMGQGEFLINEAISVNMLLEQLARKGPRLSVLIFDACRNNPYATASRGSATRGLARIDEATAGGSFIMYSAGLGEEALDRLPDDPPEEQNSVYTRHLVPMLVQPGLTLNQVAIRVREKVARVASGISHPQHPAYYDGLRDMSYCLAGGCVQTETAGGDAAKAAVAAKPNPKPVVAVPIASKSAVDLAPPAIGQVEPAPPAVEVKQDSPPVPPGDKTPEPTEAKTQE